MRELARMSAGRFAATDSKGEVIAVHASMRGALQAASKVMKNGTLPIVFRIPRLNCATKNRKQP